MPFKPPWETFEPEIDRYTYTCGPIYLFVLVVKQWRTSPNSQTRALLLYLHSFETLLHL